MTLKDKIFPVFLTLLLLNVATLQAQHVTGTVRDAKTGETIPLVHVVYEGYNEGVASDLDGNYTIARHEGLMLTFSVVGYETKTVKVDNSKRLDVKLTPSTTELQSVTVSARRLRYSRRDNPAVEMMRKVIAAKKQTDLSNKDFYQYDKYQKMTLAVNDITTAVLDSPKFKRKEWLINQIEPCPYNGKLILPVSVEETVSQKLYRKQPHDEKTLIKGQRQTGINDLIETGDILNTMMQEVFQDVNIYDDQIRLLQYPFTSPIGKDAIDFYRFYIIDTLKVDQDPCFHLSFLPNNQQDFGFRGDLYVMADSSYQVKRCEMTIPARSDVNFVENMQIVQEFVKLEDGSWVLSVDDMFTELVLAKFIQKFAVIRNTRLTGYTFDELPHQLFKGKKEVVRDVNAMMQNDEFWDKYRQVELTKSESSMDSFISGLEQIKGFKTIVFGLKALIENYVETGDKDHPSKVDIGPVNTMITSNFIDGIRTRISAQTTANLNPHLFLRGYYAHGWDSHKNYYKGDVIWSFNKKEYLPREFPQRTLIFSSTYDVMAPSDKFLHTDKDNFLTAFKWTPVHEMMFYNRQSITFEREEDWGFRTTIAFKAEENEACGELTFTPLNVPDLSVSRKVRTTELRGELRFAPGETFINTKQRRLPVNLDAPVFTVSHTLGIKDFLGGDYSYNYSEASIYKRFWLNSWGKLDCLVKGGIQWEKVPFLLLCMPETNLSYVIQDYTFQLINNMEFLNDRFMSANINWDMNGKIFNRIPLLRKLKWREWISVKCLWGKLTDKNNPLMADNAESPLLMHFPVGSSVMDPEKPYWEMSLGIHNIFKIIQIEYVRRLNYNSLPTAHKHGIRFNMRMTF